VKVLFWNIEKTGLSSTVEKRAALEDTLFKAINEAVGFDVICLAEVHSAQTQNFKDFSAQVYNQFASKGYKGGYSNNYFILYNNNVKAVDSPKQIGPRPLALFEDLKTQRWVGMLHAKSGQTGLTGKEIEDYTKWMESKKPGDWALLGDLNYDYKNCNNLELPKDSRPVKQWDDTHAKGGCLDWFIFGKNCALHINTFRTFRNQLSREAFSMEHQDHVPIYCDIQ
jgi:hypothetical protein